MANEPKPRSIESYGQGQSGYTAGRIEGDPSLQFQSVNLTYHTRDGEPVPEFADDERFAGRGGDHWSPED